ncbi:MAG: hypothetical protein ABIZ92_06630 [Vicinamibacterales bacterium]
MSLDRGPIGAYEAYNEEAFRHFMTIECKRAERSHRSLLLLLVELEANSHGQRGITPSVASGLFTGLTLCLREIDFMGWYRSGRVIGGILIQGADAPALHISRALTERIAKVLCESVPSQERSRVNVRVLQLRSTSMNPYEQL